MHERRMNARSKGMDSVKHGDQYLSKDLKKIGMRLCKSIDPVPGHVEPAPVDAPTVEHVPTGHKRSTVSISSESSDGENSSFSNEQPTKRRWL